MTRTAPVLILLKVFLVALFAFLLVLQVMSLPGMFSYRAEQAPELAHIAWLMLALSELEVLCLQVVVVCTWRLLSLVRGDQIFSPVSLAWVDVIVWAFAVGWAALAGVAAYLTAYIYFTPELRDPGVPLTLFGLVLVGAVFVLLVVILRTLLRQATVLRSDLDEVI